MREQFGLPTTGLLIVSISRLVPRKGFDVLIEAVADIVKRREVFLAIGGSGRDEARLRALIEKTKAPARLLGRISDEDLPRLTGAADLYALLCRNRWLGLEQEGFGIVFLEAAAAGVAQVGGLSGGVAEAVLDRRTGRIVDRPADLVVATATIESLLEDEAARLAYGQASRERVVSSFNYDELARQLSEALAARER